MRQRYQIQYILILIFAVFITAVFLSGSLARAAAGINPQFNYQGRLTNSSGANVSDGAYNFVFKLYTASSGGSAIWTETWSTATRFSSTVTGTPPISGGTSVTYIHDATESYLAIGDILYNTTANDEVIIESFDAGANTITISPTSKAWSSSDAITTRIYVRSGLFSGRLGSITSLSSINLNQTPLYLGVAVGADSEMTPRKRITSVLQAFQANKLDGYLTSTSTSAASEYGSTLTISDTGIVTTGTDATYGLNISATRTGATGGTIDTYGIYSAVTGDNAGAGTSTAVGGYFSATGADNNYGLIVANGYVGIGTTAPESKLHIKTGVDQNIKFSSFINGFNGTAITASNDNPTEKNTFEIIASIILLTPADNIGIGTTAPLLKLDVAGSGRFTGAATSVLTGSIDPAASTTVTGVGTLFTTELVVGDRITVTGETRTVTAIASTTSLTVDSAFSDNANDTSPDKLAAIFVTRDSSNAVKMVMNDLGNVGIGTTGPRGLLEVTNGAANTNGDGVYAATIVDATREPILTGSGTMFLQSNNALAAGEGASIAFGSRYVTGSTVAGLNAGIFGAKENATSGNLAGYMAFYTRGAVNIIEAMRINSSGNVGIGTTAPGAKLEVIGANDSPLLKIGSSASTEQFNFTRSSATGALLIQGDQSGYNNILLAPVSGNVGIGTTAPESRVQITGGGLCVGSDVNCNTDNNTEGVVYSSSTSMTVYDVAENYPTKDVTLESGDIVSLNSAHNGPFVKRAEKDEVILGAVSTEPAVLLGGFNGQQYKEEYQAAIALSGRILIKAALEGGEIKQGDKIALSKILPGIGMKVTEEGPTVGIALESLTSESQYEEGKNYGKILVFVNLGWNHLDSSAVAAASGNPVSGGNGVSTEYWLINSSGRLTSTVDLDLGGKSIHNIGSLFSASGKWKLDESGYLEIEKVVAKEVETEKLKIGAFGLPAGITLFDLLTKEPYCLYIESGEIKKQSGECATAQINADNFQGEIQEDTASQEETGNQQPSDTNLEAELPSEPQAEPEPEEPVQNSEVAAENGSGEVIPDIPAGEQPTDANLEADLPNEPAP